jgi:hypothetical protein
MFAKRTNRFGVKADNLFIAGSLLGVVCIVAYFLLVNKPASKFGNIETSIIPVVKNNGDVWITPDLSNPDWRQVPNTSSVKQLIKLNDSTYAIVNYNGDVWTTPNLSNPDWKQVPNVSGVKKITQLEDSTFAIINGDNRDVWTSPTLSSPQWNKVPDISGVSSLVDFAPVNKKMIELQRQATLVQNIYFVQNGHVINKEHLFSTGPNVLKFNSDDTLAQQISYILADNNITMPYTHVSIWNDGGFRIYDLPPGSSLKTTQDPVISTYEVLQTIRAPESVSKLVQFVGIDRNQTMYTIDSLSNLDLTEVNSDSSYLIQLKDGTFAGLNKSGDVYKTTTLLSKPVFAPVNTRLSYFIQLNDGTFAGIEKVTNELYIKTDLLNPYWEKTAISFKYFIQLKDGKFAGLSNSGNIFIASRLPLYYQPTIGVVERNTEAPYSLSYLTQLRDGRVVGIQDTGNIYITLTPGLSANTKWSQVNSNQLLSYLIELKDGTFLGIGYNKLYKTQSLLNANWIIANDNLSLKYIIEIDDTLGKSKFTNISRFGSGGVNIMMILLLLAISAFIVYLCIKRKIKI